jgi:hypothetical protein
LIEWRGASKLINSIVVLAKEVGFVVLNVLPLMSLALPPQGFLKFGQLLFDVLNSVYSRALIKLLHIVSLFNFFSHLIG